MCIGKSQAQTSARKWFDAYRRRRGRRRRRCRRTIAIIRRCVAL